MSFISIIVPVYRVEKYLSRVYNGLSRDNQVNQFLVI